MPTNALSPLDRRRPTAIIIEDDKDVAVAIAVMLNSAFVIIHAPTMASAIIALKSNEVTEKNAEKNRILPFEESRIDVILMDMVLPNGKGIDSLRDIVSEFPTIPIIVMSGEYHNAEEVIANGAQAFLEKPVRAEDLLSTMTQAIARHRFFKFCKPVHEAIKEIKTDLAESIVVLDKKAEELKSAAAV